jgi:hypothetical protein
MRTLVILLILIVASSRTHGQILISLLLGDKLNSGGMEFGLDGGVNFSTIHGLNPSGSRTGFNLGFYFDIKLKDPSWIFHTGVLVKSSMGAEDIPVYSLNNIDLDNAFSGGSVKRKLGYFNIPAMIKYKAKNNFFVEAGPMFGLMNKSKDEFVASINKKDDLTYTLDIKDRYHPLDFGLMIGTGYRLLRGNGMNLAIRYYLGLVDITIDDTTAAQYNRTLYIALGIPIGAAKKQSTNEK